MPSCSRRTRRSDFSQIAKSSCIAGVARGILWPTSVGESDDGHIPATCRSIIPPQVSYNISAKSAQFGTGSARLAIGVRAGLQANEIIKLRIVRSRLLVWLQRDGGLFLRSAGQERFEHEQDEDLPHRHRSTEGILCSGSDPCRSISSRRASFPFLFPFACFAGDFPLFPLRVSASATRELPVGVSPW